MWRIKHHNDVPWLSQHIFTLSLKNNHCPTSQLRPHILPDSSPHIQHSHQADSFLLISTSHKEKKKKRKKKNTITPTWTFSKMKDWASSLNRWGSLYHMISMSLACNLQLNVL